MVVYFVTTDKTAIITLRRDCPFLRERECVCALAKDRIKYAATSDMVDIGTLSGVTSVRL